MNRNTLNLLLLVLASSTPSISSFTSGKRTRTQLQSVSVVSSRSFPSTSVFLGAKKSSSNDDDEGEASSSSMRRQQQTAANPSSMSSRGSASNNRVFATGEALQRLRQDIEILRENLQWAEAVGDEERMIDLRRAIKNGENQDPECVYNIARRRINQLKSNMKDSKEEKKKKKKTEKANTNKRAAGEKSIQFWEAEALAARNSLQRFNMEGLWVGNYGNGPQLVNVTYTGDTLIAKKVTGDLSVPRGEVTFVVDLSPHHVNMTSLDPITVSENPNVIIPRYSGKGQVAKPNFVNNKYVSGQLLLFDTYFSFLWVPTKHHIFFKRPSPEMTISLLRNVISKEDEVDNMRSHIERCYDMDMTTCVAREHARQNKDKDITDNVDDLFKRIPLQEDLDEMWEQSKNNKALQKENANNDAILKAAFGVGSTTNNRFNFWQVHKWKSYIDRVLRDENMGGGNSDNKNDNKKK